MPASVFLRVSVQPPLVVVSGEAGMGKTSLLWEVEARALKQDWETARSDSEGALHVAVEATEDKFCSRVRALLCIAAGRISIGPLDRQLITQLVEKIGQQLSPATEASELEEYVTAVCKQPEILGSLTCVLNLTQRVGS